MPIVRWIDQSQGDDRKRKRKRKRKKIIGPGRI